MNISKKGQNGIRFLVDLVQNSSEYPVSLKEVSLRQGLSEGALQEVITPLLASGIILTVSKLKRKKFRLAKNPGNLKMKKILETLEGRINLREYIRKTDVSIRNSDWIEKEVWKKLRHTFENAMETTLEDLARQKSYAGFDWCI